MNREILMVAEQLKDAYEGRTWFGRSAKEILNEIDEAIVFEKPNVQHSIPDLLWRMITRKEVTISRLQNDNEKSVRYFEENVDVNLATLIKTFGSKAYNSLQNFITNELKSSGNKKMKHFRKSVSNRNYDLRKLLYSIKEHDIYHSGQIAYIKKMLQK